MNEKRWSKRNIQQNCNNISKNCNNINNIDRKSQQCQQSPINDNQFRTNYFDSPINYSKNPYSHIATRSHWSRKSTLIEHGALRLKRRLKSKRLIALRSAAHLIRLLLEFSIRPFMHAGGTPLRSTLSWLFRFHGRLQYHSYICLCRTTNKSSARQQIIFRGIQNKRSLEIEAKRLTYATYWSQLAINLPILCGLHTYRHLRIEIMWPYALVCQPIFMNIWTNERKTKPTISRTWNNFECVHQPLAHSAAIWERASITIIWTWNDTASRVNKSDGIGSLACTQARPANHMSVEQHMILCK